MMGDMAFLRSVSPSPDRSAARVRGCRFVMCAAWITTFGAGTAMAQSAPTASTAAPPAPTAALTAPTAAPSGAVEAADEPAVPPEASAPASRPPQEQPEPEEAESAPVPPPYPVAPGTPPQPTPGTDTPRTAPPRTAPPQAPTAGHPDAQAVYEPPLPGAFLDRQRQGDVPPPPIPQHLAPRTSFWVGARPGVLFPLGAMWTDQFSVCCSFSDRPFADFASAGPSIELDVGARFGRRYQVFAFYEHAWLGSGGLEDEFGGQRGAATSVYGAGVRFNTHPDKIGLLVEMNIGYRTFEAEWENGTRLTASDDLFSTRLGVGAEWRLSRATTVELLLVLGGGVFKDIEWTFADGSKTDALGAFDSYGSYAPIGVQLGAHWDVIRSDD